jgi:signal transduction histidine kinase
VQDVLSGLAGDAVARSRALACLVLVECAHGDLELLGGSGLPDGLQEAVRRAGLRLPDLPGGELLRAGRLMLLSDGHARLAADPLTAPVAELTAHLGWGGSVAVPLHRGGVVVGCLVLLLPASLTAPTKAELTAWSALGAHASVALADERLREQAAAYAAELERHRLGRDLHDSVIAALFSLTTRAQAVRRGLDAGDLAVVRSAAQDLEELARQAVAELRAMVTDMRGRESSSSAAELPAALRELTRSCNERDGLRVELRTEPVPGLAVGTAEHLVRIAGEALHNCVKHSGAREAQVSLEVRGSECVLTVSDDGRGFDPATAAGGHGLRIMQERALLCGGALQVDSDEGSGTRVVAHIPLPG